MKKLFALPLAVTIFAVSGCNKLVDHIRDHLDGVDKTYRIETFERAGIVGVFTYNKNNDPVKVDFNINPPGDGGRDWWFEYDKKGRLTTCYLTYGDSLDDWYQKMIFLYDDKGRIIKDTTYERFFEPLEPPAEFPVIIWWLNHYTYDSLNRITKVTEEFDCCRIPGEYNFSYDANGNLIRPGYVYDNKMNINRTNKVWMFINKDYSVNNPFPAQSYNEGGLPLVFNTNVPNAYFAQFLFRTYNQATFTYKKIK